MKQVITSERIPIKLWLDDIEEGALKQAKDMANLPFAFKWIAIMPDAHQGYGVPIGSVLATRDVIIPNAVGVDIGCGMFAVRTSLHSISKEERGKVLGEIRKTVPVSYHKHKEDQGWIGFNNAPDIPVIQEHLANARRQLGTLGGGNHFIEIQEGTDGYIWLMIHSGSRNFGLQIAKLYHAEAVAQCKRWQSDIPNKDLSFLPLDSSAGIDYVDAMNFAVDFARANRALMMERVKDALENVIRPMQFEDISNIAHNYATLEHHYGKNVLVHRKGATKAIVNAVGIIPGSMGTPSYIVTGRDNPESFKSCSHGAGRRMSRKAAKRELNLADEQAKMPDVVGKVRSDSKLDEAPGSYKDIRKVMDNQKDLVDISVELTPLANMKG